MRNIEEQELKDGYGPSFDYSLQATVEKDNDVKRVDTARFDNKISFEKNLAYWNNEVAYKSVNNYDNSYFSRIVEMKEDAVPFIIEELKKGPTPLVHALDLIFPGTVVYNGFVSLESACKTWLSILSPTASN